MPAVRQARPVQAVRTALAVLALALAGLLAVIAPVVGQSATPPPQPTIGSVTPAVVKPGAKLIIKGTGFIDVRAVSMAGVSLPYKLKSRKRIEARAPQNAARGPVTVSTRGGAINSPRQVIVKPQVTVAPPSGPIGTEVSVSGSGFIPGEPVDVSLGRVALAATTADSKGEVATSFVVPARTSPGVTTVRMQGRFSGVPSDRLYDVAASWPQRGLSASGNRRSSDTYLGATLSASLLLDWVADLIGPSGSSPAIGSDVVVVGADTGAVLVMPTDCATDGQGCTPRSIGITRGAVRGGPAIASSVAYVTSEDANVYAFDLNCGESEGPCDPLWSYQTGGPITSSPAVDIDVVVVGSSDGNVYGLDLACGLTSEPGAGDDVAGCAPRWISPTGGSISSSPAIHDGVAYVGSDDGYLYAIETDCSTAGGTCEPLWRGWTGGAVRSSPAVANGLVYVGSSDGKVHGFATGCGDGGEVCQAIWRGDADAPIESSPVVADGYVVVGANDGSVMAFPTACADRNKGCAPTWKALTGGAVRSTPAVSGAAQGGPMVFVGSDDGFLYAYPLKCRPAGRPSLCSAIWASGTSAPISASPAIVDGALYVSSEDGTVRRWSLP